MAGPIFFGHISPPQIPSNGCRVSLHRKNVFTTKSVFSEYANAFSACKSLSETKTAFSGPRTRFPQLKTRFRAKTAFPGTKITFYGVENAVSRPNTYFLSIQMCFRYVKRGALCQKDVSETKHTFPTPIGWNLES